MFFTANRKMNVEVRVRPGRLSLTEHPVLREMCLACAKLYYNPDKKFSVSEIANAFNISDETLRNRIRAALTIEGPEGNEIRRLADQSKKRRLKLK